MHTIGIHTIGIHTVTERNKNIQKEPYKKNQTKSFRITKQQQHKSRFLEALIVRQADGKLKNTMVINVTIKEI